MNRRPVAAALLASGLLPLLPMAARAQATPQEGTHYVRLPQKAPTSAGPGKVEVVEFFWYGCPHCNAFEPQLDAWSKRLPADVVFKRVPVAFREKPFVAHQRLFYALEAMGLVGELHRKIFYAIHSEQQKLDQPDTIAEFVAKNGVDKAKFLDAYNAFGVQAKAKQAQQLSEQYKIDGVPTLGIQGMFYTSPSLAGNADMALKTADLLIGMARKGA